MCGIAGIVEFDHRPVDRDLLRRMGAVQAHRGPDDADTLVTGPVGLVHRRLAIIDLSRDGRQPMSTADGRLTVVFNGEIYNYLEIRTELERLGHRFRTQSDTEVILHAYEERGPDCVHLFNGMFAIAVWDVQRSQLWLARDRLGVKPLYYTRIGETFLFASEVKALREHPAVGRRARALGIAQYLELGYSTDDGTWFEGVHKLLPGWTGTVTVEEGIRLSPYWDPVNLYRNTSTLPDAATRIRALLEDSVRLRLRSDVPVGAHLSGGLDSSSIVALMTQLSETPVHTFSGAFAEGGLYDERPFIRQVVSRFQTIHHQVVPTSSDFARTLDTVTWHMDEPEVGYSVFSQYMVCQLTAQHGIKVINGGQGGDELLGGYTKYLLGYWRRPDAAAGWQRARRLVSSGTVRRSARRGLDRFGGRLWNGRHGDFGEAVAGVEIRRPMIIDDPLQNEMYWDLRHYIPGLLHVEDRTSMAASIESRIPFLDYRLVEMAASIPPEDKMPLGSLKELLRSAMRDLLPPAVTERRDKRGFPTPLCIWFRGPLRTAVAEKLGSEAMRSARVFDQRHLGLMQTVHQSERFDVTRALWPALAVASWFEQTGVEPGW